MAGGRVVGVSDRRGDPFVQWARFVGQRGSRLQLRVSAVRLCADVKVLCRRRGHYSQLRLLSIETNCTGEATLTVR
jgi:hypothetical protein